MAPINKFIANAYDDPAAAATTFSNTADLSIIDAFPPYHWEGPQAYQHWRASLAAVSRQYLITDHSLSVGKPVRVELSGDKRSSYLIVPAFFRCKFNGKDFSEAGVMTYILRKGEDGWRIHAWAWSGPVNNGLPVK